MQYNAWAGRVSSLRKLWLDKGVGIGGQELGAGDARLFEPPLNSLRALRPFVAHFRGRRFLPTPCLRAFVPSAFNSFIRVELRKFRGFPKAVLSG